MKKLLSIFAAIALMVACTEFDSPQSQAPTITLESATTLSFNEEGGESKITFTSSEAWTAKVINTSADNWISIHPTSGDAGDASITVTIEPNDTPDDRSASIIIQAGNVSKSVNVSQKQKDVLITDSSFEVGAEGGEVVVAIRANINYKYAIDESAKEWIGDLNTRAMKMTTLSFSIAKNNDTQKREGKIYITSGEFNEVVNIYQAGEEPTIILSQNEYVISADGATIAVNVASNVDVTVEIPADADWISQNVTRSISNNTYYFDIAAYEENDQRTAEIKFTNNENGLSEVVVVKQITTVPNNEIWYTSSDEQIITPGSFELNIISNVYENGKGVITFDRDVTSIGDYAFGSCGNLTSIAIPNSVTSIGEGTFWQCTNLRSIAIPNSVTSIGDSAFNNCRNLTSIAIPNSVTSIGEGTFWQCTNLRSIAIPNSVTSIGDAAFHQCSGLTSITIPNSVTSIGDEVFYACHSLTSITISDGVTSIGERAFEGCYNLTSITIPNSVTSIGDCAFCGCSSLTAFYGKYSSSDNRCLIVDGVLNSFAPEGVTEYTIPDGVTSIGNRALDRCRYLTSITIPDGVTSIGDEAFYNIEKLKRINIPDSVTSIGDKAFYFCANLPKIIIPENVTSIGKGAFDECRKLTDIYVKPINPPKGDNDMFWSKATSRKIYVPMESVDAYKTADYWKDYAYSIVGYEF